MSENYVSIAQGHEYQDGTFSVPLSSEAIHLYKASSRDLRREVPPFASHNDYFDVWVKLQIEKVGRLLLDASCQPGINSSEALDG